MSHVLVIRVHRDGLIAWSAIEPASGARLARGELGEGEAIALPGQARITRTLCLLPSEDVFYGRVDLPARTEAEARQAAPFLIEDELAEPLDTLAVSVGPRSADGKRAVAAASRSLIESWRERVAALAVKPLFVMPDCAALSGHDADLVLFDRRDALLFHSRVSPGIACGGAVEPAMERVLTPVLIGEAQGRTVAASATLGLAGPTVRPVEHDDLDVLAARLDAAALKSMPPVFGAGLAHDFSWSETMARMRRPAAIAAALLLGFTALTLGEGVYYRAQRDVADQASVDLFRAAFPDAGVVRNPIAQLNNRMRAAGGGSDSAFLPLMAGLAEIAETVENVRIDAVRYDAARGGLSVSAVYSSFEDYEALRQAASERGFRIEDGGAQQTGAAISGDFTLWRA